VPADHAWWSVLSVGRLLCWRQMDKAGAPLLRVFLGCWCWQLRWALRPVTLLGLPGIQTGRHQCYLLIIF
jgi:hypothetical protein